MCRLKKEIDNNKELQQTLKDLKGDGTLNSAAKAARDAAAQVQRTANQAAEQAAETATRATSSVSQAAEQASKAGRAFVDKDKQQRSGDRTERPTPGSTTGSTSSGGATGADGGEPQRPLYERLMDDVSKIVHAARSQMGHSGASSGPVCTHLSMRRACFT